MSRIDRRVDRIQTALGLDIFSDSGTVIGDSGYLQQVNSHQDVVSWLHSSNLSAENIEPERSEPSPLRRDSPKAVLPDRNSHNKSTIADHRLGSKTTVSTSKTPEAYSEYLDPNFDLETLTVPRLRPFLFEYGVKFNIGASKAVLVSLAKQVQGLRKSAPLMSLEDMHNGERLITLGGRVYDITEFIDEHPYV